MEIPEQEKISSETLADKKNPMRAFSYLCKKKLLFCCIKCNKLLTTNAIIEKILRLRTGKICFILGDEKENSELFEKFKNLIIIEPKLKFNNYEDFHAVGLNEITCKNCKNSLGVRMKQTDDTQIFMLDRIVLKERAMKYFAVEDIGIVPFYFNYKVEDIKKMDQMAFETEDYINKSGNQIQKFFDLLSSQVKDLKEIETKKKDIDKLSDILKYLIDKDYL